MSSIPSCCQLTSLPSRREKRRAKPLPLKVNASRSSAICNGIALGLAKGCSWRVDAFSWNWYWPSSCSAAL
ncbi:hypothetical protein D3C73_1466490 [compost metagenome]